MKRSTVVPLLLLLIAAGCDTPQSAEQQLPTAPTAASERDFPSGTDAAAPGRAQVAICHKPGTSAQQTLNVADPAVPAHLRHGDRLGACGLPPGATACPIPRVVTGSQGPQAMLTFQDTGPGLLYLTLVQSLSTNANVTIPSFDPATSDPVAVVATRIDPARQATFVIMARVDTESTSSARSCSYEL
jgi:hypothetical protein